MRKPKNRIEYLRLKKFMSQADVAKLMGYSQSHYGKLERNPLDLSVEQAIKLANILGAKGLDDLIEYKAS